MLGIFALEVFEFLYTLDIINIIRCRVCKYFHHSVDYLFTLLIVFFAMQKLFKFNIIPFVYFCFPCLCFPSCPKYQERFLLFSFDSFIVLGLTLKFSINFELIFVNWERLSLLHVHIQFSQHHLLRDCPFINVWSAHVVKNLLAVDVWPYF